MLKIKRIKITNFRGIIEPRELVFCTKGQSVPKSFILFGDNSSGKTSFVDGIEWFLSSVNRIEWLAREGARCGAYPHLAGHKKNSSVEIEFNDSHLGTLSKQLDLSTPTKAKLSNSEQFKRLYGSFVIKPYLCYMEIARFVLSPKSEKYKYLARWMGFESKLKLQEMFALEFMPRLKEKIKEMKLVIQTEESKLTKYGIKDVTEGSVLDFCNKILIPYGFKEVVAINKLGYISGELRKLGFKSESASKISNLLGSRSEIFAFTFNQEIRQNVDCLFSELRSFQKEKILLQDLHLVDLYQKGLEILTDAGDDYNKCPLCGVEWNKKDLLSHIKAEIKKLESVKLRQNRLLQKIRDNKILLNNELEGVKNLIKHCKKAKNLIGNNIELSVFEEYATSLQNTIDIFERSILSFPLEQDYLRDKKFEPAQLKRLKQQTLNIIDQFQKKLVPTKKDAKLVEDSEKIRNIKNWWGELKSKRRKYRFYEQEFKKVEDIIDSFIKIIGGDINENFGKISSIVEGYFKILRPDKDIKDIKIKLIPKSERKRAGGRSAELELKYYDVKVEPAYKILSESLLNSLGLSIFFACIKVFNKNCKFFILDDIINSLDKAHRSNIIKLLEKEFSSYQIILLTHDDFWFERLQRKFPTWIKKKIKNWSYENGPEIDYIKAPKEEFLLSLQDPTQVGKIMRDFGNYLEGVLNELCESLEAKVKHRYLSKEPLALYELFEASYSQLKDKLGKGDEILKMFDEAWQEDALFRNFCSHDRRTFASNVSKEEVGAIIEQWFSLEERIFCNTCKNFIIYRKEKGYKHIDCPCGKLKLL